VNSEFDAPEIAWRIAEWKMGVGGMFGLRIVYLFALAGVLNILSQVAVVGLGFASGLLNLSFQLHIVVADEVA
jgi:hypothetical protein